MKKSRVKVFTSLFLFFDSLILLISGTMLFIMPHGRIAYWLNWKIAGINKTGWENLHVASAVLFVVFTLVHLLVVNWPSFVAYFKPARESKTPLRPELAVSFLAMALVMTAALLNVPPVSTLMDAGESVKESWVGKENKPPFPHAELMSIRELCKRERISIDDATKRMKRAGIKVKSPKQRLAFLGRDNDMSARDIFLIMKGEE